MPEPLIFSVGLNGDAPAIKDDYRSNVIVSKHINSMHKVT